MFKKKFHKFKAKPINNNGLKFSSTLEYNYYNYLNLLIKSGEVVFFLRQVPFHLPGGVKYVTDYQVFYSDGMCRFIDIKGFETSEFKIKKRIVESLYPVEIEIIKKGDF
ncbi:MAG TPA: DUF1064 domain-containing protein [Buchnera sp. (in: enterobacteria)]|nr:DUF1064 domain-containing protein [Buchnera sp. (in: enterobacteria)]